MARKIILIDGNSLVYRAFFALPTTLTLPSGQATNAVYGFTSMLIRLLIDERPDSVAVAFDSRGPTWRHGQFEGYKATRQATPDELIPQFPLVKEVLTALAIPVFEAPGHEADDILATLVSRSLDSGNDVLVVTGDRDAFQLIRDERVRVMTTRRGITDIVIYDRAKVIDRYGVTPEQVPDFLGLKGDASDNIPGVPGVGEKTAAKLIQKFGSLENIYQNLAEVGSEKLKNLLLEHREQAEMSKTIAVLNREVPIDESVQLTDFGRWDENNVREVFARLEFRTLLERFEDKLATVPAPQTKPFAVELLEPDENELAAQLAIIAETGVVGVDILFDTGGRLGGLTVAGPAEHTVKAVVIKIGGPGDRAVQLLKTWWRQSKTLKSLYDTKGKLSYLTTLGLTLEGDFFDPMVAAYLLSPTDIGYELQHLTHRYLERRFTAEGSLAEAAAERAAAAGALVEPLEAALRANGLETVFRDIEMPLCRVLARMETCGVGLDRAVLANLSREIGANLSTIADKIYALAEGQFNINSPQQVGSVLFDKLGLKPGRKTKTKTSYATDAATLGKLATQHEIVPLILEHRELAKLKSTYIDALPKLVNPATGRLHTSFNQTITATGRLSSSNPNLQNIPTRTELGREIRRAFVPAHRDEKLLAADYSQIELRLLAHLSGDQALVQAFSDGADIHAATAAEVFDVPLPEVQPHMRRGAKAINFGIIYGMSPFGLSEQLGISPDEAKDYIDRYFTRYPAVQGFLERTVKEAYRDGFVTTITGRKRFMPELNSTNYNERSFGERVAVNAPLQGSAADIIKIAMINIDRYLINSGLQTRMVLQVHDELVFEVPPLEEAVVTPAIKELMETAYPVSVPLEVTLTFGRNWGEAK